MNITLRDVKEEKSFSKIADLYKSYFPKQIRIKTKTFHKYAFMDGIYFKSFYINNSFIGFCKGFNDGKNVYISWLAPKKDKYFIEIVNAIINDTSKFNLIFAVLNEEEIKKYLSLGLKQPVLCKLLESSKGLFACTKPELFNDKEIINAIKKYDWPLLFNASNKTSVYYARVDNLDIDKEINKLPPFRKEKANKYAFDKDKKLSIGAYLLLCKVLKKHHVDINKYEFKYEEKGKPYLEGCPLHFSISHSLNYVAVAINKNPVGVDIQETKKFDEKLIEMIFNEKDHYFYDDESDKIAAFYKIWTFKEAYIKMTGEGLSKPLKDIRLNALFEYNGNFFYNFTSLEGYQISTCSPSYGLKEIKEIKLF